MKTFTAAIFDLDGVIIDSTEAHRESWKIVLAEYGLEFNEEKFIETFGIKNDDVVPLLFGKTDPDEIVVIADKKEAAYRDEFRRLPVLVPGIEEYLRYLKDRSIPLAVASSAPKKNIDMTFELYSFMDLFDTVVEADDVVNGKPHPEVFLKAADNLGIKPNQTVVFEDAIAGVEAGKAAGMFVVALATSHPPEDLKNADLIVSDFTDPQLQELF
ncbi:MAG: HAD family phosphatase [Candidatus Kerfeldbacteria bacterium]